jgi:hypothetical protein
MAPDLHGRKRARVLALEFALASLSDRDDRTADRKATAAARLEGDT